MYYGPVEDLEINGAAEIVLSAAMFEVYEFDNVHDRTWFSWNNEPECRKGLDADTKYLGLFNGPSLEPKFYELGSEEWPNIESLK